MKISNIKPSVMNFKSRLPFFISKDKEEKFRSAPKMTINSTNEYFLELDRSFQCIPSQWEYIYSLNMSQRKNLIDLMRLTYKTHTGGKDYTPANDVVIAKTAMENVNKLIRNDGILSKDEADKVYGKVLGSFEMAEIVKLNKRLPQKIEASKENLKFVKDLMRDENKEYFEAMSPRTLVGILLEEYLDYDFYVQQLRTAKEDKVLSYPEDEIRNTLNIYFLGKDIPESDTVEKFDKLVSEF